MAPEKPTLGIQILGAVEQYMVEIGCCDECLAKVRADMSQDSEYTDTGEEVWWLGCCHLLPIPLPIYGARLRRQGRIWRTRIGRPATVL